MLSAAVGVLLLFFHANVPATSVPSAVLYVTLPPVRVLSESVCPYVRAVAVGFSAITGVALVTLTVIVLVTVL